MFIRSCYQLGVQLGTCIWSDLGLVIFPFKKIWFTAWGCPLMWGVLWRPRWFWWLRMHCTSSVCYLSCIVTVIHTLVTVRLDYCNALYLHGAALEECTVFGNMTWSRRLQNAETLSAGFLCWEHVVSISVNPYWWLICFQAQVTVLILTFMAKNSLGRPVSPIYCIPSCIQWAHLIHGFDIYWFENLQMLKPRPTFTL